MTPPPKSGSDSKAPEAASMRFEAAVEELESIIGRIESGDLELEESMALHRRGQELLKACRARLESAEQDLQTMALDDDALSEAEPGTSDPG